MTLDITIAGELGGARLYTDSTIENLSRQFDPFSFERIHMSSYQNFDIESHLAPLVVPRRLGGGEERWYGLDSAGYNAVARELQTFTYMGNNPENSKYFRLARIETMPDGSKVCFPTEEMLKSFHVRERECTG